MALKIANHMGVNDCVTTYIAAVLLVIEPLITASSATKRNLMIASVIMDNRCVVSTDAHRYVFMYFVDALFEYKLDSSVGVFSCVHCT